MLLWFILWRSFFAGKSFKVTMALLCKTSKGGEGASCNGYIYRKDKRKRDGTITWRCTEAACRGRLMTTDVLLEDEEDSSPEEVGEQHNPPNPEATQVRGIVTRMKQRARQESLSIPSIYREETANIAPNVAAAIPSFHSLDASLYRGRRERYPPLPQTRTAIVVADSFRNTVNGERFFLAGLNGNDITLVFVSDADLGLRLWNSEEWFIDGTFKAAPLLFMQLVTIHCTSENKCLPLVYALLSKKTRQAYNDLLRCLKDAANERGLVLQLNAIISNFESGLAPVITAEFHDAIHRGCYFHFCQAVYRKVQALGLQQVYRQNVEMRSLVRSMNALAFLSVMNVTEAFEALCEEQAANFPQLDDLIQYFHQTWIVGCPLQRWNVAILGTRTNNHVKVGIFASWPLCKRFTQTFGRSLRHFRRRHRPPQLCCSKSLLGNQSEEQ